MKRTTKPVRDIVPGSALKNERANIDVLKKTDNLHFYPQTLAYVRKNGMYFGTPL